MFEPADESEGAQHILAGLTESQREAVQHIDGPLLILAGPGSGKTRVVSHRMAWMLEQGIYASHILALTFTNKAADELKSRVASLAPGQRIWTGTFHRFCARLLREFAPLVGLEPNFAIYDVSDSRRVLKRVLEDLDVDVARFKPEQIAAEISRAKNEMIGPDDYQATVSPVGKVVEKIYPLYQRQLLKSNAVDFDDLLLHVAVMLREHPEVRAQLDERYRYVMVDEYQDTNLAQYVIVRALCQDYPNLAVTGDPDQSIYGWRGANVRNILDFEHDYPQVKVVRLEQNYRSTQRILSAADQLIRHNRLRKDKRLFTANEPGQPVHYTLFPSEQEEAEAIAQRVVQAVRSGRRRPRDFAVFYRINALSRVLESYFRQHGVPYRMVNSVEFYQRKEIKDVMAYLSLVNNPRDDVAFLRVVNEPARGIGKTTLERLSRLATENGLTLLEAAHDSNILKAISKKSAKALSRFAVMMDQLAEHAHEPVATVLGEVLIATGYRDQYQDSGTEEDMQRVVNIEELFTVARQFDEAQGENGGLEAFLEASSLVNDTDAFDEEEDCVSLMTLHAAKGLEFPVVSIIALEEGVLPHDRCKSEEEIEEERRLLFVGITRAKQELYLSSAKYRTFRGTTKPTVPSWFLSELPRAEMDWEDLTRQSGSSEGRFRGPRHPSQMERLAASESSSRPATSAPNVPGMPRLMTADQLLGLSKVDKSDADRGDTLDERLGASRGTPAAGKPVTMTTAKVKAAASATTGTTEIDPDLFYEGMVVLHPSYGPGKVEQLAGRGANRRATVQFPGHGRKSFVIAKSPLRPAGG